MTKMNKKEREAKVAEMLRLWRGGERGNALKIAREIDAKADEQPAGMFAYAQRVGG